jgi:hypothetical protein
MMQKKQALSDAHPLAFLTLSWRATTPGLAEFLRPGGLVYIL